MNLLKTMAIMTVFALCPLNATQVVYNMSVQYPVKILQRPSLVAFYKGGEYLLKEGAFEIYDARNCTEFHIIITANIKLPHTPDITFLETSHDYPYKLFKLSRRSKTREVVGSQGPVQLEVIEYWDIQELVNNDPVIKIPDNSIIFLMNPAYIIKLASESWKPDDIFIKLPTLIFDETIDEKTLHEASTKMLFAALDLSVFHKKITKTVKHFAQNRILSVQDPLNSYISNHPRV